jgi:Molybdate transporter of MFS superfamily
MGLTGAITWIEKVTTKPVVRGIMLGLGLSFIGEGLGMMRHQPLYAIGGVPLCHGAGGMAGHIRFGARTGGALVILGAIVLMTGLFLSDSVTLLFQFFPRPILGVILFFAGIELALVVKDIKLKRQNLFVLLVTAGTAMWNMGVAYLAGLLLYYGIQRRWIRV